MRTKKPVDEKMVAQAETEMVKCLDQIQSIWLKGGNKKFLAGDQISIADLMATTELEQPGKSYIRLINLTPFLIFINPQNLWKII